MIPAPTSHEEDCPGHRTLPGSKASKIMGGIALAVVVGFVLLIWAFVRST